MCMWCRSSQERWLVMEDKDTLKDVIQEEVKVALAAKKGSKKEEQDSEEQEEEAILEEGVDTVEEIKEGQESKYGI